MTTSKLEDSVTQPWWAVIEPDEGESLWQPMPSSGYVTMKLTPDNMPYDSFSTGVQILPPGCHVREHGHKRNHELIFIYEGQGEAEIEGETYPVSRGSTIFFGRYARHIITNTGDTDMGMFWVFMPPGLEDWFRGIGRQRQTGEPMPAPFPRPEGVAELMEHMRFVPPAKR